MQSIITLYLRIREIINDCGPHGKNYHEICQEFSLTIAIQKFIALSLIKDGYVLKNENNQTVNISVEGVLSNELIVFTPYHASRIYGFQAYDEIVYDPEIFQVLGYLGRARAEGLTLAELQKLYGKKFNTNLIDKLIGYGIVVKQTIMPKFVKSSKRASNVCNIIHLRKYAQKFNPDIFGLKVAPHDAVLWEIILFFSRLLEKEESHSIMVSKIRSIFKVGKKVMQNFRGNILTLEKQKDFIPIRFECRCMPGSSRRIWFLVQNAIPRIKYPMFSRIRNIPYHEQVDLYIHQRGSITNNDIKRLTSVPRKKSFRTGQDLIHTFGFPTVKEQENKTFQYRIMPKSTQRPIRKNLISANDCSSEDVVQSNENEILESKPPASTFQKDVIPEVKTFQSHRRKNKRKAEIASVRSSSTSDDSEEDTTKKIKSRALEQGREEKRVVKETIGRVSEKDAMILDILHKSTFGVSSMLEITQLLRDYCRENSLPLIDKKTIVRARDRLISSGQVNSMVLSLDSELSKNFNNAKEAELLYISQSDENSLEDRIQGYVRDYRYFRFGLKRKTDSKVDTVVSEVETNDLPENLIATESLKETNDVIDQSEETNPKPAKRRRRSKMKKDDIVNISPPAALEETEKEQKNRYKFPDNLPLKLDITRFVEEIVIANELKPKEEDEAVQESLHFDEEQHPPFEEHGVEKRDRTKNDVWSLSEEIELLLSFLGNFFVRKARQGMPDYLKPHGRAKRAQNVKTLFTVYPWDSSFDIDWKMFEVSYLTRYYIRNATVKTASHSLSSCRRRINRLLKGISNFHHLISVLLQMIILSRNISVSAENQQIINYILHLTGKRADATVNQIVLSILLKFYDGGYNLIRPTELIQVLPVELDQEYLRLIMKELFLHGFLKTAVTQQPLENSNHEVTFRFTKNYQKSIAEKLLGLFYYLILFDQNFKYGIENYQEEEFGDILDKFSIFSFEDDHCQQRMNSFLDQQTVRENNITSIITVNVKDNTLTFPICRMRQNVSGNVPLVNYELCTDQREHNEEDSKDQETGKETELIQETGVKLIFSCAQHKHFYFKMQEKLHNSLVVSSIMESMNVSPQNNFLPWLDNEGGLNVKVFNVFTCHVISYLSEYPGSSLEAIHAMLVILSMESVEILMIILLKLEIVKKYEPAQAVELSDPFDSLEFWNDAEDNVQSVVGVCGYQVCVV